MKFTLDLNTWRCGEDGPNKLGHDRTALLNSQGYMCCLGQFSEQLDRKCDILNHDEPYNATYSIRVDENPLLKIDDEYEDINNSDLAEECIQINDDQNTTVIEKINLLKKTLKKYGHTLVIKNDKLFDKSGRLINVKLLASAINRQSVESLISGTSNAKIFSSSHIFAKQLLRKKGVEKTKEILKRNLSKFN